MNRSLLYAQTIRNKICKQIEHLTIEQLNVIPEGMNNNIAWHIGHLAVTSEILCYVRSGIQPERVVPFADQYKNGTKPDAWISQEEFEGMKQRLLTAQDELQQAYDNGEFAQVQPYATLTFGIMLHTIEEVFECCALHDALHWGNIAIMRKLV